jgi:hypothetical protein
MSYTPANLSVFIASYTGALAGMACDGRNPVSALPSDYVNPTTVAGAFAQEFDTNYSGVTHTAQIEAIKQICQSAWAGRLPLNQSLFTTPGTYLPLCSALFAIVNELTVYFAGQGINDNIPSGGGGGPPAPATGLEVFVNVAGNDTTGDGTQSNPFRTINRACTLIRSFSNASTTNRYAIRVGPGRFTEALVLTDWTYIVGDSIEGTRVSFTSLILGPEWTANVDHRSGFQSMTISGAPTIDFNAVSSNQGKLRFDDIVFNDRWTYTAFSSINQVVYHSCFCFDGWTQNGINFTAYGSAVINGGTVTMNSINDGRNLQTLLTLTGSGIDGNLAINWATSTGSNAAMCQMLSSSISGTLTLNGLQASIYTTGSSPVAFPGGVTLLNSAVDPRKNITGAKSGNTALASTITQLVATGGFTDSTT